jgi:hypothetical protein
MHLTFLAVAEIISNCSVSWLKTRLARVGRPCSMTTLKSLSGSFQVTMWADREIILVLPVRPKSFYVPLQVKPNMRLALKVE